MIRKRLIRNKNKNKNGPNIRTHLRNVIPISFGKIRRTINIPLQIPTYHTSNHYTFANASDTRYLQFSTVMSALEFSNLASVYQSYRICSASCLVCPGWNGNSADTALNFLPMLYVNVQPSKTGINPTNLEVIAADDSHVFSAYATITPQTASFSINQPGSQAYLWLDTASLPTTGNFVIGDSGTSMAGTNDFYIFDCIFSLTIELKDPK
jgi:hypothetical protein